MPSPRELSALHGEYGGGREYGGEGEYGGGDMREREYELGGIWSWMRECGGEGNKGNIEGDGIRVILNMERDEEYGSGWGIWKGMGNMEQEGKYKERRGIERGMGNMEEMGKYGEDSAYGGGGEYGKG
jgi:hypothetical protein